MKTLSFFEASIAGNFKLKVALIDVLKTQTYNVSIMETQKKHCQKSVTLHDAGGWFLLVFLLGIPFIGLVLDYFWNYLVFSLGLRWVHFNTSRLRKHVFCLIITSLGLLIDWLYFELTWGYLKVNKAGGLILDFSRLPSLFPHPGSRVLLEFATILIPMAILFAEYFILASIFLHLKPGQAKTLSAIMGFLTAPWLIVLTVVLNF